MAFHLTSSLPLDRLPVLLDDIDNNPVILILLQAAYDHHRNHTLNSFHLDRHATAVNGKLASLFRGEAKLARERPLVAAKLAVPQPGAHAPARDRRPLARNPALVIGSDARACRALVEGEAIGQADVDERGARIRRELCVEEVTELPGV